MLKYFSLTKLSLQRHFAFRARFLIWLFVDLSQVFIFPFIWLAIYGSRTSVGDFSRADIVTYYVVLAFVSVTTTAHHGTYIARDILDGKMSIQLVRPIKFLAYHWYSELGYHIATFLTVSVISIIFFLLFPEFALFPKNAATWLLFIGSLVIANIVSSCIQIMVGLGSFWLGQVNSLFQLRFIVEKIFSGEFAPLTLYPALLQSIALSLPFQFIHFVPIQIYLEKISIFDALRLLGMGCVWITGFCLIILLMWRKGIRRYDGSGI